MALPPAPTGPPATGGRRAPAPTFSTFQPSDLTRRSCPGLSSLPGPRPQAPKAAEAQPGPRAPAVDTVRAPPRALGTATRPEDAGQAEEAPRGGGRSLQAETRAWFQRTQARGLLQHGAAPPWFHGFITRREAERLLETEPPGCYLVRFSESVVTFVLTYRSQTCCRHFLLAQLGDGSHVVLGEDSTHARLQDLLRHYTACPLGPYGETLGRPLARQKPEPAGLSLKPEDADAGSNSQEPPPQHSRILRQEQPAAPAQEDGAGEPTEAPQPPRPRPPVRARPQLPREVDVGTSPAPRPRPAPPARPSAPVYQEPDEPIAFYAMGRGGRGGAAGNVYAEVEATRAEAERPSGAGGRRGPRVLRQCRSRPLSGSRSPGGRQLRPENSVAGQAPPAAHQPQPRWGHTLPHDLSRQGDLSDFLRRAWATWDPFLQVPAQPCASVPTKKPGGQRGTRGPTPS